MKNSPDPLVSVIIPAYNQRDYLKRAIKSACGQSYPNMEIIVVDDGSSDGTDEEVSGLSGLGKIIYLYQKNQGTSIARNNGIEKASGDYIAFLDQDDYWESDKIEKQVRVLQACPESVLCYTDAWLISPDGKKNPKTRKHFAGSIPEGKIFFHLLFNNPITLASVLVRASALAQEKFVPDRYLMEVADYGLWLRFAEKYPFSVIDEPLTYYQTRAPIGERAKVISYEKNISMFRKNIRLTSRGGSFWYYVGLVPLYIKYSIHFLISRVFFQ
jgi:glycosyltransferase involved in cell wall biosynthesis